MKCVIPYLRKSFHSNLAFLMSFGETLKVICCNIIFTYWKGLDLATRNKKKVRCFIPCTKLLFVFVVIFFLINIKNGDENNHNLCIIYMSHRDIWIKYSGTRIFGFFENKMSFQTFQRHTNRFTKLLYNTWNTSTVCHCRNELLVQQLYQFSSVKT